MSFRAKARYSNQVIWGKKIYISIPNGVLLHRIIPTNCSVSKHSLGVKSKADCETPNGAVNDSCEVTLDGRVDDTNVCDENGLCNDDIQVTKGIECCAFFVCCQHFVTNLFNSRICIKLCNSLLQTEAAKVGSLPTGDAWTKAPHLRLSLPKANSIWINLLGTQAIMQKLTISESQALIMYLLAMIIDLSETA